MIDQDELAPQGEPQPGGGWKAAAYLAVFVAVMYLAVAGGTTLFDRDEPRFSRAAVEMVQSGNYLYPTFNGELRADKPILIYWLMAASLHTLGALGEAIGLAVSKDFACRVPSAIAGAISCLIVFWIGRRLFNARVGVIAMVVLATSPLMIAEAILATADSVLLCTILLSFAIYFARYEKGLNWWSALLLGTAVGAAQLTKGPVGLAVVGLSVIMIEWLRRRRPREGRPVSEADQMAALMGTQLKPPCWKRQTAWLLVALLLSIAIFIVWAIPANIATDGRYAQLGLGKHVGERMVSAQEGHGASGVLTYIATLPVYVLVVLLAFFPWTQFLPAALRALLAGDLCDRSRRAVLIGWFVPTFVLMSLVVTKLPHYVLPVWPALALGVAAMLDKRFEGSLPERYDKYMVRGLALTLPLVVVYALGVAAGPWIVGSAALGIAGAALALVIIVGAVAAVRGTKEGQFQKVALANAGSVFVALMVAALMLLPAFEPLKLAPTLAPQIREKAPADIPITTAGFGEPTLIFYLDRPVEAPPVEYISPQPESVRDWLRGAGPAVLVIDKRDLRQAAEQLNDRRFEQIGEAHGLDGNGRWREIVAIARDLDGGGIAVGR